MDAQDIAAAQERLDASLPYDPDASCITVVTGLSRDDVLVAFGGDPTLAPVSWDETDEADHPDADNPHLAALFVVPGGVVVVEGNGFEGTRREVLRRASAQGRAGSVFWNVNMDTSLNLAERGEVVFDEEPFDELEIENPAVAPFFQGADFGVESWVGSSLIVIERFTGVRLEGNFLEGRIELHRLEPHLDDPYEAPDPEPTDQVREPWEYTSRSFTIEEDFGSAASNELTAAVVRAAAVTRRQLANVAVHWALRAAGLEDHPDVIPTLTSVDAGRLVLAPETVRMLRKVGNYGYGTPTPPAWCALTALQESLSSDSVAAALNAIALAGSTIECVEREREYGPGGQPGDWELRQPRSQRSAERLQRDRREFLLALYSELDLSPSGGVIPPDPGPPRPEDVSPSWTGLAPWLDAPWGPRVHGWTGKELLVFGDASPPGWHDPWTPLGMPTGRAGGAYDPAINRWRGLRPAPFPLTGWHHSTAHPGGLLVRSYDQLTDRSSLSSYSVHDDTWTDLGWPAAVPNGYQWVPIVAGSALAMWAMSRMAEEPVLFLLDPSTTVGRAAPPLPWPGPASTRIFGFPDGRFVALDHEEEPPPVPDFLFAPDEERELVAEVRMVGFTSDEPWRSTKLWRAAVLDPGASQWRVLPLPDLPVDFMPSWHCAAGRLISLQNEVVLDPATGLVQPLPRNRGRSLGGGPADYDDVLSGQDLVLRGREVYDARHNVWWELPELPTRAEMPLCTWAGNRLLVFAHGVQSERDGSTHLKKRHGWSWTPGAWPSDPDWP